jgi:PAS domain S-box-containing protein
MSNSDLQLKGLHTQAEERDRFEQKLRETEISLLLALQAGQFAAWAYEPARNRAEISPQVAEIFGHQDPLHNWGLEQVVDQIHSEDRPNVARLFAEALETGSNLEFEMRIYRPDKTQRWIWVTGRPLLHQDVVQRMVGLLTDVTEKRKADLALQQSESRFRRLVETSSIGINIGDLQGRISYINPSLLKLLGYTKEEVKRGELRWDQLTPPEYSDADHRAVEQLRTRGTCQPYEKVYLAKDGHRVPILLGATDISEQPDGPTEIAAFVTDLTQLKQAESALERIRAEVQHQWAELETIYRTAPVGLCLFSVEEFRYLRVNDNQAAIIGLPAEQIIGKRFGEIAPNLAGIVEPLFVRVIQGEPIRNFDLEGELPSQPGVHRYWTVSYSPVFNSERVIQAISAVIFETTAQKRTEQALIQGEKLAAVGRLASSISHEINNPLEAVTNLIYLATTRPGIPNEVREILHLADKELSRVSQIASQTLRFHRQSTKPTLVSPVELLKPIIAVYQGRLFNSGISLDQEHEPVEPIRCLENDIRQVLNNLISNALDANKRGGHVLIRSREATDWKTGRSGIRITIGDTGCGMSQETKRHIFEAFFTTKGIHGTGLGLWISKGIVDKHSGRLHVYGSNREGCSGAVFSVFLPRLKGTEGNES